MLQEVRFALRRIIRDPVRSGISIIAFAFGIGLTASMFSIGYTILFRGTPFDGPDDLVMLERRSPESGDRLRTLSFLDFLAVQERQRTLSAVGAWTTSGVDLADDESQPVRLRAARISTSLFDLLRVSPVIGRAFAADEFGPDARVVLLSDGVWQTRYGGSRDVLGRSIRLDGENHVIIGVMEDSFQFPTDEDVWLPLPFDRASVERDAGSLLVMGRLPAGTSMEASSAELGRIYADLAREEGSGPAAASVLVPYVRSNLGEGDTALLWAMMLGSLLVLAIACVNVTNLLTAVAADRTPEVALRTVLGASRSRILAQLLLDALVLALAGGTAGVVLAYFGVDWFERALTAQLPIWLTFEVDGPILVFAMAVSCGAAMIAGLTPAIRMAGVSVREVLQDESRGSSSRSLGRLNQAMVVATMALAYPLLVAAGLLIASLGQWSGALPFDRSGVLVAGLDLPERRYADAGARTAFVDDLLRWAESEPAILGATWGTIVPGLGTGTRPVEIDGEQYPGEEDRPVARVASVRPGYFGAMGVAPSRGRTFQAGDRDGPPVTIVNESFVARHFPATDPLGARVRIAGEGEEFRAIVGVMPDLRMNGASQITPEGMYLPTPPSDTRSGVLLVRASGDASSIAPLVRAGVADLDPDLPLQRLEPIDTRIEQAFWVVTVVGPVFTTFGLCALFLASVGLFGVMAHSVSRRTREIGVRMALGADSRSILVTVASGGLIQTAVGVVLGSGLAIGGSRLLASALFGVRPGDPTVMLIVGGALVASALLATVVPAVRAVSLSPLEALRSG